MNKKGFYFTAFAIMLLTLIFFAKTMYGRIDLEKEALINTERIWQDNKFINDLIIDAERALYIGSFRTNLAIFEYMTNHTNNYLANGEFQVFFAEAILNGSVNGISIAIINESTWEMWEEKILHLALNRGLIIQIINETVEVVLIDPWTLNITIKANATVEDLQLDASWFFPFEVSTQLSIEGFEDPVYYFGSDNVLHHNIQKTPYNIFVDDKNTSNLVDHATNQYYTESTDAPNFIMRYEGNFNANSLGIESLVNSKNLEVIGLAKNKTITDYIYFDSYEPYAYYINHSPGWLILDDENQRLKRYNCSEIAMR